MFSRVFRLDRFKLAIGIAAACILTVSGSLLNAQPAAASVDDFSYDSWHGEYVIDVDDDGRAVATVTETLVARFPDFDQNRGIIRGLPLRYEGAPAAPENVSVTNEHGDPVPFAIEDQGEFRAILTGDDSFVRGPQTYVIEYTLHDVVLAAEETQVDEFYWDLVPIERRQPVNRFSAELVFSPELAPALTGDAFCYAGFEGSSTPCSVSLQKVMDEETGAAHIVLPEMLSPAQRGVTVAVALEAGTVTQPPARTSNAALDIGPGVLGGAGLIAGLGSLFGIHRMRVRHRTHRGIIVAQYDVPDYLPPLIAAPVIGAKASPISAEMLHLAVSGVLRIEDTPDRRSGRWSKRPRPALRMIDPFLTRDPIDRLALTAIFPSQEPGTSFVIPRTSESFAKKMTKLASDGKKEAQSRQYFTKQRSKSARVSGLIALGLLAASALLLLIGGMQGRDIALIAAITGVVAVPTVVLAIVGFIRHSVHTPLGAETREYLEGVREFIRVAEADRLQVLQSHTGAERLTDGSVDVVHVYEKLLPYAMLFGMVKEWSRVLETTYASAGVSTPYWYPSLGNHGLHSLDSRLSALTSSIQSSASYTSSSSGGSSGGGFSGGGGGGGFSGGR